MKKPILIFTIILTFTIKSSSAQNNLIDSLSFNTEKGLLIFEGYLNGVKTDFAFDTGASLGALNSKNLDEAKIEISGSKNIRDSQKKSAKLDLAKINTLKIGPHSFSNITSVVADMPFLFCNKTYLLGGDIINKLNWKFDFKKNIVYFSKTAFTPENNMQQMPFKIVGNRHFTNLTIANTPVDNILIDFGYAGNCTMDANIKSTKEVAKKVLPENLYKFKSSSMGINTMSSGKPTNTFFMDSVVFGGVVLNNFKINAMVNTHNKIGLYFLKNNFNQLIINSIDLKYWLLPNNIAPKRQMNFDASFHFNDKRKIEVVALNGSAEHSANLLNIGQTITELNARNADSFTDRCDFLIWYAEQAKKEEFSVITDKGEKLTIKKSVF
ncbi:retropepsin-like aspartic protease [Pedobacter aquatilis]|uniref:retropepsin-like aspartic protease n=1 Tax=Pedobacter aquatilis TaxID=351343 RepID=UPI0025B55780|nr:retropepsin-like aspartic protease [Pedobacter aquatilis]MDN3587334.1 retropepsin-like aspartic protease [Pedobacter aquatilis]